MKRVIIKTILTVFVILFTYNLNAQDYEFDDFWQFRNEQLTYFDSLKTANDGELEGTGHTQFMRWLYFWQEAVFNDGGYNNSLEAKHEKYLAIVNGTEDETMSINVNWEEIGPLHPPGNKYCITNPVWNTAYYPRIKGTGRCYFIELDPQNANRIFTGSPTGGLFYSNDGGESWINGGTDFLPNPGIAHMQVNPQNSNAWFITTGEGNGYGNFSFSYGIFRTLDNGQNWKSISNGLNIPYKTYSRKILIDPNNGNKLFAVFNTGVYKTENAMAEEANLVQWELVQEGNFRDIQFMPGNTQIIYASGKSIYWSLDGGDIWGLIPNIQQVVIPGNAYVFLGVTDINPNILYAGIAIKDNPTTEKLYKWDYITQSWNNGYHIDGGGGLNPGRHAFEVAPYNEDVVFLSDITSIYMTPDMGNNWFPISDNKHDDTHWIKFTNTPGTVWIGTDGGINKSTDYGSNFVNKTNNIGVANMHNIGSGKRLSGLILYGGYDTGTSLFEEDDNEWYQMSEFGDSWDAAIDDSDINSPPTLYFTTQDGLFRSYNGGYNHTEISIPSNINALGWGQTFSKDYYNQSTFYLPGYKRIGRSFNQGNNWEAISANAQDENPNRMWIKTWNSINNPDFLYAHRINPDWQNPDPGAFRLFVTSNCRANPASTVDWNDVTPVIDNEVYEKWISDITIDENNPENIWVCYQGYTPGIKVLHYNGTEWIDMSGVPIGPNLLDGSSVISIVYQINSNNLVYIGTNAGVYYSINGSVEWTKLEGIPNTQVNELEIDYCTHKLRAATFGRGLWETDLLGTFEDVVLIADKTWDDYRLIKSNIIIPDNITLTISSVIELDEGSKIIVNPGGKLIIDGGLLTNSCNNLWQGIEVWGTASALQNPTDQGVVLLKNGAVIENAVCAIQTIKFDESTGEPNYNFTGGIVNANNAIFKNNTVAVQFYDYATNSFSSFRDCDFIVDDGYIGDENPGYAIIMNGMSSITFTACDFTNNSSENCFGSGIYSFDSWVKVQGGCADPLQQPCEEWIPGTFTNLEHGVYATSGGSANFPIISHIDFDNNHRGVYFSGTESGTVEFCDFTTGPNCANNGSSYGVYLDRSTGYTIEENDFVQGPADAIGLVVNNSGGDPNIIYRNTFTGLLFGSLPQQANRSISFIDQGLQYKCNQFYENGHDIVVVKSTPSQSGDGIKQNQGADLEQPDGPAGNRFTQLGPWETDIYNNANNIVYYYHIASAFEKLKPEYVSEETVKSEEVFGAQWLPEVSCPPSDNGGGIGSTDGLKGQMASSGEKADSVQNIINILKDGGSTENMKLEVDLSTPPETFSIYNELMGSSPYISDTVMSAAIEKEDVLPNVMIRDIMVANPHNAKNDELLGKIEERSDPMPDYMKAQIVEGGGLVSLFENLQSQKSYYGQKRANAFNALVRQYVNDTIDPVGSTDSLKVLLQNENTLAAKYRLAFLNMGQGDWGQGQDILDNMPQQFDLTTWEQDNHSQIIAYSNIVANLAQQGKGIMEADSSQIAALFDIEASGAGIASVYARNVLLAMGEIGYDEPILMPDFTKSSAIAEERAELMKALAEHRYLEVFPNPAGDYLIIGHELELLQENPYAEIRNLKEEKLKHVNLSGKQNQKTIGIKELKPGVYIVTLFANNKEVESVKFTKTK